MTPALRTLFDRVLTPRLSVNSGVYSIVDPRLQVQMDERGEYQYVGLDHTYDGPADDLLEVSAFGGVAPSEDRVARDLFGSAEFAKHDPVIGHYLELFAGWSEEPGMREQASSGGIATLALLELMRSGRIDGVIHLKPSSEQGRLFSYQISRTEQEVREGAKSRYYPGELSGVLSEVLNENERYALVAIPSIVYEVRLLQRLRPQFSERIPYIVGLICGHQKSALYASALCWRAGESPDNLVAIDFRKKVPGKPANKYATELTIASGDEERTTTANLNGTPEADWGLGILKTNFSDFTEDAFNETADIVLGDAWLPEYTDDYRGTNVVIVRNETLLDVLKEAMSQGRVHLEPLSVEQVQRSQTALVRQNIEEIGARFDLLRRRGEYTPTTRRAAAARPSFARRLVQRARLQTSRQSHDAFHAALRSQDYSVFDHEMRRGIWTYRQAQRITRLERKLKQGPRAFLRALRKRVASSSGSR